MQKDTYRHIGMRRKMVEDLMTQGISDELVLKAMLGVPRHFFFDNAFVEKAYENRAFPIGEKQTISHPYTVAHQSSLLQLKPGMKVLEVGTGSAYQACVLSAMGMKVVTIERFRSLYEQSNYLIRKMKYPNITTLFGDGFEGAKLHAPFDRILVTAAAPHVPQALLQQLKIGGIMVIPLGDGEVQKMLRITKKNDIAFIKEEGDDFRFVPMLKGKVF